MSGNLGYTEADVFSDNDSLAALCGRAFDADVVLLLTDVKGVYDRPPSSPGSRILPFYFDYVDAGGIRRSKSENVLFGAKSSVGRGGMEAKINAALSAVKDSNVKACVIACGQELDTITSVLGVEKDGQNKGTLFVNMEKGELFEEVRAGVVERFLRRENLLWTRLARPIINNPFLRFASLIAS